MARRQSQGHGSLADELGTGRGKLLKPRFDQANRVWSSGFEADRMDGKP